MLLLAPGVEILPPRKPEPAVVERSADYESFTCFTGDNRAKRHFDPDLNRMVPVIDLTESLVPVAKVKQIQLAKKAFAKQFYSYDEWGFRPPKEDTNDAQGNSDADLDSQQHMSDRIIDTHCHACMVLERDSPTIMFDSLEYILSQEG